MIILTDVMIIVLPIIEIRKLQLAWVKKTLLACLFGLGIFVIACTIIRMVTVSPQTTASDQICTFRNLKRSDFRELTLLQITKLLQIAGPLLRLM